MLALHRSNTLEKEGDEGQIPALYVFILKTNPFQTVGVCKVRFPEWRKMKLYYFCCATLTNVNVYVKFLSIFTEFLSNIKKFVFNVVP